jgi:hypothetical protein
MTRTVSEGEAAAAVGASMAMKRVRVRRRVGVVCFIVDVVFVGGGGVDGEKR